MSDDDFEDFCYPFDEEINELTHRTTTLLLEDDSELDDQLPIDEKAIDNIVALIIKARKLPSPNVGNLPIEMWEYICLYLAPEDLFSAIGVNKITRLTFNENFFKHQCKKLGLTRSHAKGWKYSYNLWYILRPKVIPLQDISRTKSDSIMTCTIYPTQTLMENMRRCFNAVSTYEHNFRDNLREDYFTLIDPNCPEGADIQYHFTKFPQEFGTDGPVGFVCRSDGLSLFTALSSFSYKN